MGDVLAVPVILSGLEVATKVALPFFPKYPEVKVTVALALPAEAETDVGVLGFFPPEASTPKFLIMRLDLRPIKMYC